MDKKLSTLIIVALILTAVVGMLGAAYFLVIKNPDTFAQKAEVEEAVIEDTGLIEEGIDVATGFIAEGDYQLVKISCTGCHSAKLVTQNRATREGWLEMIRWMQETQKLWDLQPNEDKILDYLATYYAPENEGRRRPLEVEEWYVIE